MKNHSIDAGSIFYVRWGYGQTNIDFYQVTHLIGKATLDLRELYQIETPSNESSFFGRTVPAPNQFKSPPINKRINKDARIKIDDRQYARLWSGNPLYYSTYG